MVLLASPKAGVRTQWRQALQGVALLQEAAARADLERRMAKLKPAVLLLDLALPALGGVGGIRAIQRFSPLTKIVLLTDTLDEKEGVSALKAGARGYCHTDIDPSLLKKAVEMVQKGEIWVGRMLTLQLLEELTSLTERGQKNSPARSDLRFSCLTPRQREIVQLVGCGATNKEIAGRLNITEGTVKAHLTGIFRKTGCPDRLRLALFVTEHRGTPG
jgi:DNA-binding NarL/FixJ family response regulator